MKQCFVRLILILSCFFLEYSAAAVNNELINISFEKNGTSNEIKFISKTPISSAIFLNNNKLWFVLDKKVDITKLDWRNISIIKNLSIIQNTEKHIIGFFEIISSADYEYAAINNNNNNIIVKITPYDNSILSDELSKERKITKHIEIKNSSVEIELYDHKSTVITFNDPFTGESFFIIPEVALARTSSKVFVDFTTLESLSGIVIKSLNDSLRVKIQNKQVNVSSANYLNISDSSNDMPLSYIMLGLNKDSKIILDLTQYNAQPVNFTTSLDKLNNLIHITHEPAIKAERFLNLSLFLLANKWYLESKSILELVNRNSNIIANNKIKMIVGATYFMADAVNEAHDITNGINLKDVNAINQAEIGFWQRICSLIANSTNVSINNSEDIEFNLNVISKLIISYKTNFLNSYNSDIFNKICFKVAESAIIVERFDIVRNIINILSKIKLNSQDQRQLNYLNGKLLTYYGDNGKALLMFKNCTDDINDGYYYSRCKFEALNSMYKLGKITNIDYINNLQGLSTIWRGDNFEFQVLDQLANFYNDIKSTGDAIRVWQIIANHYPGSYKALISTTKASQAFVDYFNTSIESKLIKLGFFYEFQELIPLGDVGDDIIIQVTSYMLDLGMVDQAIKLIEYQIKHRLIGITREYAINNLVNIYSSINKWDLAEQTVELFSKIPLNITNPVIAQRQYLYVKALIHNNQIHDAIAVLYGDSNPEADDLRSEAFFKLANWESFNDNSEPYLYSIRYSKNSHLTDSDYIRILRQNISYFNGSKMQLLNDLYLDVQLRFKKNQKYAERNRIFYNIANELNDVSEMTQDKKSRITTMIDQLMKS